MDGERAVAEAGAQWQELLAAGASQTDTIVQGISEVGTSIVETEEANMVEPEGIDDLIEALKALGAAVRSREEQLSDQSGDGFKTYVEKIKKKLQPHWEGHPCMMARYYGITPEAPFRGFAGQANTWGFTYRDIPGYFGLKQAEQGWTYMLRTHTS